MKLLDDGINSWAIGLMSLCAVNTINIPHLLPKMGFRVDSSPEAALNRYMPRSVAVSALLISYSDQPFALNCDFLSLADISPDAELVASPISVFIRLAKLAL